MTLAVMSEMEQATPMSISAKKEEISLVPVPATRLTAGCQTC